jgi:hypothetical protein
MSPTALMMALCLDLCEGLWLRDGGDAYDDGGGASDMNTCRWFFYFHRLFWVGGNEPPPELQLTKPAVMGISELAVMSFVC